MVTKYKATTDKKTQSIIQETAKFKAVGKKVVLDVPISGENWKVELTEEMQEMLQDLRCKNPNCFNLTTSFCEGCKKIRYCSSGCQTNDWMNHKKVCRAEKACSNVSCKDKKNTALKLCSCKKIWYCSPVCQRSDWKDHKEVCSVYNTCCNQDCKNTTDLRHCLCKKARYCSKACQKTDWVNHRNKCAKKK